jgi:hypothetical protein
MPPFLPLQGRGSVGLVAAPCPTRQVCCRTTATGLPGAGNRTAKWQISHFAVTFSQIGWRLHKTSYFAARILQLNGFDARSILGGAHHQLR